MKKCKIVKNIARLGIIIPSSIDLYEAINSLIRDGSMNATKAGSIAWGLSLIILIGGVIKEIHNSKKGINKNRSKTNDKPLHLIQIFKSLKTSISIISAEYKEYLLNILKRQ